MSNMVLEPSISAMPPQSESPDSTLEPVHNHAGETVTSAPATSTKDEQTATPPITEESSPTPESNITDDEDEEAEDPILSLERDSPQFKKATISLFIQLLPDDGHPEGRTTLLAVKSHNLPPLTVTRRFLQIGSLPHELETLLTRWEQYFAGATAARQEKRNAEKAKADAQELERTKKRDKAQQNTRRTQTKPAQTVKSTLNTPTNTIETTSSDIKDSPAPPLEKSTQSSLF